MTVDDSIQVCCSHCKMKFRDKARRVRGGYSRQCPGCERMIFFEDGSPKKEIDRALREAERVRKAVREAEAEQFTVRRAPVAHPPEGEGEEAAPAPSGRMVGRRFTSSGRARR